ncbi:MAG: hypothetical protein AVDCRST_MAG68-4122 [uncultured Gemmatimonadetes bacterium]|uniref:Lipoprotein n=1 Tax=uncultured Gemmatimonadota bacterium TaxID=203437 RepID=A0A6J4MJR0_9BACT|nr:MAG: hypothetical protein AVDCRST_MAG68-4122 [uncultured Gemmatimonadota bacterium]
MKLHALTALALAFTAACANEAAKGDRNTGTALEGGTPAGISAAPAPEVTVDTVAAGRASTTNDPGIVQATDVTTTTDSAAKAATGGAGTTQSNSTTSTTQGSTTQGKDSAAHAGHP